MPHLKRSKPYKPDSVPNQGLYHLSRLAFAHKLNRPTHCRCYKQETSSLRILQPIWSFNTQGLPKYMSPYKPVSSYLTFSPLPRNRGGIFSVALSVIPTGAFLLGSELLYVVRTFLSSVQYETAIEPVCFPAKIHNYVHFFHLKILGNSISCGPGPLKVITSQPTCYIHTLPSKVQPRNNPRFERLGLKFLRIHPSSHYLRLVIAPITRRPYFKLMK